MPPNDFSDTEQELLGRLVSRQHEQERAESRVMERFGNRAALAKQVWTVLVAVVGAVVFGTIFVFTVKNDVERNARDLQQLRADCPNKADVERDTRDIQQLRADSARNADRIEQIRLDLKDKADKKSP